MVPKRWNGLIGVVSGDGVGDNSSEWDSLLEITVRWLVEGSVMSPSGDDSEHPITNKNTNNINCHNPSFNYFLRKNRSGSLTNFKLLYNVNSHPNWDLVFETVLRTNWRKLF